MNNLNPISASLLNFARFSWPRPILPWSGTETSMTSSFSKCQFQTGTAVGKLLTLGGLGIWWIVDIFLLVTGHLNPDDNSNWIPLM